MMNKLIYECVNRTMQDLMKINNPAFGQLPFGGKVVLAAGDFRQILPIIRHGERAAIVSSTIKRSNLWESFSVMHLTENMRVKQMGNVDHVQQTVFSDYLLRIGNGREPTTNDSLHDDFVNIQLSGCNLAKSVEELIQTTFPNLQAATIYSRPILQHLLEELF